MERASGSTAVLDEHDALQLAIDAAGIGTWNWHIPSGRVLWTRRTYELFGYDPGVETLHATFLQQVHVDDRPSVSEWLSRALAEHARTALQFRIHRTDGTVRWVRSAGRAMLDAHGEIVRMVGVVEDITEEKQLLRGVSAPRNARDRSLSARQVGHVLGVSESTVKRLATAGSMQFLRSSRKNSRRFTREHVLEHLRAFTAPGGGDFDRAARAEDMNSCLVHLLEQLIAGASFEALLDECVERAAHVAPPSFIADLLVRLPFLDPGCRRQALPALLVAIGTPEPMEAEMIGCVLRAHGLEVLRPSGSLAAAEFAELVARVRARCVVIITGHASRDSQGLGLGLRLVTEMAARSTAVVCVRCQTGTRAPRGIQPFRTMRQLGSILRSL
jgi:PAS domain S-box-containing protein/excisionase family DNA binding protein